MIAIQVEVTQEPVSQLSSWATQDRRMASWQGVATWCDGTEEQTFCGQINNNPGAGKDVW